MTQHIVSSAAESGTTCCAYRRWRCVGERKIRDQEFSDLPEEKERLMPLCHQLK
ncbi:TPA_asm: hypothetical protein G4J49_004637 [Salmonella enterica subsp. enterica serovar Heidelberg]|uniref:Uncharacterized protein n=1 Tax=Salmonella enterica subsp. enterica serovar Heidelberg TaxID=611 RepID=A0A739YD36_SALET|nr:hypothetical protein [Salmonella enterica]HAE6170129.1 hypothetical protein [Salmonella enterica subsp. enterica serovar Heidelberg]HAE9868116.1 hypothetical protein [Salmonella enterica subsp. enterica serovar Heidelberg]